MQGQGRSRTRTQTCSCHGHSKVGAGRRDGNKVGAGYRHRCPITGTRHSLVTQMDRWVEGRGWGRPAVARQMQVTRMGLLTVTSQVR